MHENAFDSGSLATDDTVSVAVVITREDDLNPLLSTGMATARMHNAVLHVFCVTKTDYAAEWFAIPDQYDHENIVSHTIGGEKSTKKLIKLLTKLNPLILGVALDHRQDDRYMAGSELEMVLRQVNCPVYPLQGTDG